MTEHFILFGTEGCHLCEQAKELLDSTEALVSGKITIEEVDICGDQQWLDQYSIRIPVLYYQKSHAEFDWPFEPAALELFIDDAIVKVD